MSQNYEGVVTPSDPRMVVTVDPTIMSGTVVRWYRSEAAVRAGSEYMSASRDGVMINVFLHTVADHELAVARDCYENLRRGRTVAHIATHKKTWGGELIPMNAFVHPETP